MTSTNACTWTRFQTRR